ncbi:MAG: hypothetical protein K2X66_08675 [Cyanobacteria bacterium]|nr:hypothetical protein [Cyanobacteriota bacterium]
MNTIRLGDVNQNALIPLKAVNLRKPRSLTPFKTSPLAIQGQKDTLSFEGARPLPHISVEATAEKTRYLMRIPVQLDGVEKEEFESLFRLTPSENTNTLEIELSRMIGLPSPGEPKNVASVFVGVLAKPITPVGDPESFPILSAHSPSEVVPLEIPKTPEAKSLLKRILRLQEEFRQSPDWTGISHKTIETNFLRDLDLFFKTNKP